MNIRPLVFLIILFWHGPAPSQQLPDRGYRPPVINPAYTIGQGPTVCLDEAHNNFHTLDNRFWAFSELLRRDGYVVVPGRERFTPAVLRRCRVLVIANAGIPRPAAERPASRTASAFTEDEVQAVHEWVGEGGALLLIADHRPYGGAASNLARAFGLEFTDGYALEERAAGSGDRVGWSGQAVFRTADGTLRPHVIVSGRNTAESVTSVRTFTGQAFRDVPGVNPLLVFPANFFLLPDRPTALKPGAKGIDIEGWLQGATMTVGAGRAAFFGEAAMFSAQVSGPDRTPMGMNAPTAEQNHQFILNLMHWLSGLLPEIIR